MPPPEQPARCARALSARLASLLGLLVYSEPPSLLYNDPKMPSRVGSRIPTQILPSACKPQAHSGGHTHTDPRDAREPQLPRLWHRRCFVLQTCLLLPTFCDLELITCPPPHFCDSFCDFQLMTRSRTVSCSSVANASPALGTAQRGPGGFWPPVPTLGPEARAATKEQAQPGISQPTSTRRTEMLNYSTRQMRCCEWQNLARFLPGIKCP